MKKKKNFLKNKSSLSDCHIDAKSQKPLASVEFASYVLNFLYRFRFTEHVSISL